MSANPQRREAAFSFTGADLLNIKEQMLSWARPFSIFLYLDSNSYQLPHGRYECLLAAGAAEVIDASGDDPLSAVQQRHDQSPDWLFGHICYDYKNILEPKLHSRHPERMAFPLLQFFVPEVVLYVLRGDPRLHIASLGREPEAVYEELLAALLLPPAEHVSPLSFTKRLTDAVYLDTVHRLRQHIRDGDCYEINLCNEGYCTDVVVNPLQVFRQLQALSPAPFAACYRSRDGYLMCASPERYLQKTGSTLISQPIKGTARRGADAAADALQKQALRNSEKEQAENVMIVDLVRNDLARSCRVGSVEVEELFGIYTFPQVHQMISTVRGGLREEVPFTDAIRYSFPMGSMTGAPKHKVMQLIDRYEGARRELFSGTVGYITPEGDFDFNVIIRSLFYNAATQYLSYQTGGAITWDSDPQAELEEVRLKAWALERVFGR